MISSRSVSAMLGSMLPTVRPIQTTLAWLSMAPLGGPVVPEV